MVYDRGLNHVAGQQFAMPRKSRFLASLEMTTVPNSTKNAGKDGKMRIPLCFRP
jgi:hypothetical protein